jgi:hypothetical protein
VRVASRPVAHARCAWNHSATRRHLASAALDLSSLSRLQRVRLVAMVVIIAMAVHMGVRMFGARAFEPLTFLLPALLVVMASAAYLLAPLAGDDGESSH